MSFKNVILFFHDIVKIKLSVATTKEVEYAKNKYKKLINLYLRNNLRTIVMIIVIFQGVGVSPR